jgi:hypothetical protein
MKRFCMAVLALGLSGCSCSCYVARAYFFPGSNTSLRGYPTIDPPEHFTGTWTHYSYSCRKLAILTYCDGDEDGKQVYLDDSGKPFLIRYIKNGQWDHDDLCLRAPPRATIPFFFPQRWLNPSIRGAKEVEEQFREKTVLQER